MPSSSCLSDHPRATVETPGANKSYVEVPSSSGKHTNANASKSRSDEVDGVGLRTATQSRHKEENGRLTFGIATEL